jgi:hypothetical protein
MVEADFDDADMLGVLARITKDGPGTDDLASLPPGDFESFSADDVEKEDDE